MLVAESLCWRLFRYIGDFLNVLYRSPISQTCHQHIWSPRSVTNIDVTELTSWFSVLIVTFCYEVTNLQSDLEHLQSVISKANFNGVKS